MATEKAAKPKFEPFSTIEGTVESFIADGFAAIQEVGEEFREIVDNAPDNLRNSSVNEARDSTASTIEGLSESTVNSSILGSLSCSTRISNGKLYRGRVSLSRAARANNGAAMLRAAADAINAFTSENDELPDEDDEDYADALQRLADNGWDVDDYREALEEADNLAGELESAADEVENCEFPGMFG